MKETINILDLLLIKRGRAVGNSTRQMDFAIQKLFEGYIVIVQDHYRYGDDNQANGFLFNKIIGRLEREHKGLKYKINRPYLTIELL